MNEYKYKNPLDEGYKKFKLTRKQHNSLFKYRQIKWFDKYEYYYNDKEIILHKFINIIGVLINTILFPMSILLEGVVNIKKYWIELKKLYSQKETGSFSGDDISHNSDLYKQIMIIIKDKI